MSESGFPGFKDLQDEKYCKICEILSQEDERFDYGEEQWFGIGFLGNGVAVVVWTERRGDVIRIISA